MRPSLLVVIAALVAVAACGPDGTGDPDGRAGSGPGFGDGGSGGTGGTGGSAGSGGGGTGGTGGTGPATTRLASGVVGPAGGTVATRDPLVAVVVPPGALASQLTLTVDLVEEGTPATGGGVFDLGPSGTTFALPVRLVFNYPEGTAAAHRLRVATRGGGAWTVLDGHEHQPFSRAVSGVTTHFSEFGLIEVRDPASCAEDEDCGEGKICNPSTQSCEDIRSCEDVWECGGGFDCVEHVCRFVCQNFESCQGHTDDDCDGEVDEDCPTCEDAGGAICDGICTDTSMDDFNCGECGNVCGEGFICSESRCWDITPRICVFDEDCGEGFICWDGYCEPEPIPCRSSEECPRGTACIEGWCY